jgi:nucleoside-diphosphate-sugar epimerase
LKKTVLITGAGGAIGTILRRSLGDTYTWRLLSSRPLPDAESIVADLGDLPALLEAFRGVDSIVHLAARASVQTPWDDVLHSNIVGVYNVYEAAAQCGVKQVIYASTNHTVGTYDLENAPDIYTTGMPLLDHTVPVRPDSLYGVSKCFGESLGRYYVDHRGLHVLCLRIGFVNRRDDPYPPQSSESRERLAALWLSQRDAVQLIEKSLLADDVPFDIVYGISNNQPHYYDLEHAREVIGYVPQDGARVDQVKPESSQEHH